MNTETEFFQTVAHMPESLKQELFHYAKYLIDNYARTVDETHPVQDQDQPKKRRSGILKGTFVLPLSDDFDEPLEDFKEYMEWRVLF